MDDAVKEYRNEMDVIEAFLSSEHIQQGGEVKSNQLYAVYCKWAEINNEYKMSSTKFGREIAKRYEKKRNNGSFYVGISLVN